MVNYYAKRVGQTIFTMLAVVALSFVMYRLLPYGPVEILKVQLIQEAVQSGEGIDPEQLERIDQQVELYTGINPDLPLHLAFLNYMEGIIFHLDFGRSFTHNEPVFGLLFERMPWSVFLSVYGLALGTTVSLLMGAMMAHHEGSKFDKGMTVFTILNSTIPYYLFAIGFIIVFGFMLGWFPIGGRYDPSTTAGLNLPYIRGVIMHAAMPIASLFIAGFGGALAYRGNCIRELGEGYIRAARLRGISEGRLALRYVGRNALLPIYTGIMMGIAGLFGSGVIVEIIFDYRAVGMLTFDALLNRDYPLLMGSFMFFTAITLTGVLIADLTYGLIDPRVQGGDERESF